MVDVEIWDTVGMEKYHENFIYSQNYVQGKNGVMLVAKNSQNVKDKLQMLDKNCSVPVSLFLINTKDKEKTIPHYKNVHRGTSDTINPKIDNFIEKCIDNYVK